MLDVERLESKYSDLQILINLQENGVFLYLRLMHVQR